MLDARRDELVGLGVRHVIAAGLQSLLRRSDAGFVAHHPVLQQRPGGGDVAGVHEVVHHEGHRMNATAQRHWPAGPAHETSCPRERERHNPRGPAYPTQDPDCLLGARCEQQVARERVIERVAQREIVWFVVVEQRHIAVADVEPPDDPVAADVADLDRPVREADTGTGLDPGPHVVVGDGPVAVVPTAFIADVGRGLEREHAKPHRMRRPDHRGDLVDVVGGHRHVVREMALDSMLAA